MEPSDNDPRDILCREDRRGKAFSNNDGGGEASRVMSLYDSAGTTALGTPWDFCRECGTAVE